MVTCLCFTCTDVYDGVSACGYSAHTAVMSSQVRGGGCEMGGSGRGRGRGGGSERGRGKREGGV